MLDEGETDALAALAHFVASTLVQLLLSLAHASVLGVCCLLLLRVPLAPLARRLAVRELALLLLGGYAFALEPLLQRATRGSRLEGVLRLEPMLACLTAGALVCNRWEQRRAFAALLRRAMPPVRRRLLNAMHPRLQPHAATPKAAAPHCHPPRPPPRARPRCCASSSSRRAARCGSRSCGAPGPQRCCSWARGSPRSTAAARSAATARQHRASTASRAGRATSRRHISLYLPRSP